MKKFEVVAMDPEALHAVLTHADVFKPIRPVRKSVYWKIEAESEEDVRRLWKEAQDLELPDVHGLVLHTITEVK